MTPTRSDDAGQRQLVRTLKTIYVGGEICGIVFGLLVLFNGQWIEGVGLTAMFVMGLFVQLRWPPK